MLKPFKSPNKLSKELSRHNMLFALTLLSLISIHFEPAMAQPQISGNPVGCASQNAVYQRFQFHGKVLLNQAFLPNGDGERMALIRDAIELQIKHLVGYFRNTSSGGMNAAISAYRGDLKIEPAQKVQYGNSFAVDNFLSARGLPQSRYTQKAIQRGQVTAQDPALLIPYQSELLIADCTPQGFQKAAPIDLPLDPYLSLWLENKDMRRPRAFGSKKLDGVPNCFSSEIVEFGTSDVNWYFWSPIMPKTDAAGKQVQCRIAGAKTYRPEFAAAQTVPPPPALTREFFGHLKEFKSTAIFGIISSSDYFAKLDFAGLKHSIQTSEALCKTSKSIPFCLTAWEKLLKPVDGKPYIEPGSYHFITFLKYLHTLVSLDELKIEKTTASDQELLIKYRGHFIDSTMPTSGTVYFGTTTLDYGPRATQTYVATLHTALKESNAIFYVGHAGLGRNFQMDEFSKLWKQDRLPAFERDRPVWVGLYNCEGFSYYGFDQERIFKTGKFDLYLTASSGTEAGAKYPLAQLSILNDLFAGKSVDVAKTMANYVQSREFSTITRISTRIRSTQDSLK